MHIMDLEDCLQVKYSFYFLQLSMLNFRFHDDCDSLYLGNLIHKEVDLHFILENSEIVFAV